MSEAQGSSDTSSTAEKAKHPKLIVTSVVSRTQISPMFSRITISGGTLSKLRRHGYDHWFRMFIARTWHEDTDIPLEPVDPDWASSYQALADDERPNMRYVTVREHRWAGQPGAQVDVDVVIHGNANDPDCGPLSRTTMMTAFFLGSKRGWTNWAQRFLYCSTKAPA